MPNAAKPGRATFLRSLNHVLGSGPLMPAEASESTVRRLMGDPPALGAQLGEGLQSGRTPEPLWTAGREVAPFP